MKNDMKRRLAIYAMYDKKGQVDDYIIYCINGLAKVVNDIIVVSNNILEPNAKQKLNMVTHIYERSDNGYDVGAFAHVICDLQIKNEMCKYDELILLNDSIFGPFYPLTDMFSEMDKRETLDFWGITKRGNSDFDGGEHIYPEHMQLYFYVIRKRMLHSREFVGYWNIIPEQITDFRSAIINYEFTFTKYFEKQGYKWDVYCKTEEYNTNRASINLSPYHYASYELIKNEKCPFMKRKMCTGDFVNAEYCDKSNVRKAIEYVDKYTNYDIDLVWKHILKVYHIEDILEGLQMYRIIDDETAEKGKSIEQIQIIELKSDIKNAICIEKEKTPLSYTLVINFKNLEELAPLNNARKNCLIENLFPYEGYSRKIVKLFEESPRLGLLIPPLKTFGKLAYSLEQKWENDESAVKLYRNNRLHVPFRKDRAPIYKIDGFLCRSELLNQQIIQTLKGTDGQTMMQMMPLIAQEKGYYTEVLIKKDYVSRYVSNLQNVAYELWKSIGIANEKDDMDLKDMKDMILKKRILEFCKNHKKIYIYGAGQLAYRIIRILQETSQIEGIVVSDLTGNESILGGYQVQCIDDIVVEQSSFIIAVGKKNTKDVIKILSYRGIKDYLILN